MIQFLLSTDAIAIVSILAGATVSVLVPLMTLVGAWLHSKSSQKNTLELARTEIRKSYATTAATLALSDHKQGHELALELKKQNQSLSIAPLSAFLAYHWQLVKLMDEDRFTKEEHERLWEENKHLFGQ